MKTFRRSPEEKFPCDYFDREGVFLYYDDDGRFEAVEFSIPSPPLF
jgi:hypothetical protein